MTRISLSASVVLEGHQPVVFTYGSVHKTSAPAQARSLRSL